LLFEVNEMNRVTISQAARLAGVGVETIRFYERKLLIEQPPKPKDSGFRDYPIETVRRIRFIRQAQDLGFSLKEIDELLSLRADPSADCADVRARASAKLEDVNEKIARLNAIQAALQDLIGACPGRGPAARCCSILEALGTREVERAPADRCQETEP
jgi:MerR family mercuric resistance operon transcriptional regulator